MAPLKPDVWVGLASAIPVDPNHPDFEDVSGSVVWVVALATNERSFGLKASAALSRERWSATGFEDVKLFKELDDDGRESFRELVEELHKSGEPQFSDFHVWNDANRVSLDEIEAKSQDGKLSVSQKTILANLVDMVKSLHPSQVDEDGYLLEHNDDGLTVTVAHKDENHPDLEVIAGAEEIEVEFTFGHLHFNAETQGEDWLQDALDFIWSLLNGGVKVEIWEKDNEWYATRTLVQASEFEWETWDIMTLENDPLIDSEPDFTYGVGFSSPSNL